MNGVLLENFRPLRGKSLAAPVFQVGGRPPRIYHWRKKNVLHDGTEILKDVLQIFIGLLKFVIQIGISLLQVSKKNRNFAAGLG